MALVDVLFVVAAVALTYLVHYRSNRQKARAPLPPGPAGIPFFGNLFQVHSLRPYPQFREWALKYGEIFYLRLGPQNVIVLNSAEAADELMVNRSANYSSRASPHVAHDIVSGGQRMVFLPYDREWKTVRRSLQGVIGPNPSRGFRNIQELETRIFLFDLCAHADQSVTETHVQGPNDEIPERHWFALVRRFTTSVVLNVTYGRRVHRLYGNPHLHKIYDVLDNFVRVAQPGNYLADAFPILRLLPDFLAPWRTEARKMHEWEMELWGSFLEEGKAASREGIVRQGFINTYLRARADAGSEDAPGDGLTDDGWMRDKLLTYTGATVLEAGSDTTAITIQSFVLFMLSNPHVLRRARAEIDAVIGSDRMPEFEDEERLPYMVACIKETMRRRPPITMGVPHMAEQDDVYHGYHIPKGSTIIGNVWAIHMDPRTFPNPTAFDPDHYYTEGKQHTSGTGPDSSARDHYVFGWGRRFCQGSFIAEASIFIALSRLVWGIDFSAPIDKDTGRPFVLDMADEERNWNEGFVSGPKIFPARFKARSQKHAEVIQRSFVDAQAEWQAMGLAVDER
ncbi:cytochrome P450 [Wolfiporia cocos MD-104 SS10]|uniref:Cytochrome P450 n=1 Tax=Wolfiporia cocos (strain MD-104) TaxID=742152 RepID=A0A2H3IZX1_WOLCO|nr:cytochrome P450 [Wolfiporia cocos MD-104 SS10]